MGGRLITAEAKGTYVIARINQYCRRCRTITSVAPKVRKVREADYNVDEQLRRNQADIDRRRTERLSLEQALPWSDVTLLLDLPRIRSSQLYTDWSANIPNGLIMKHRRRQLGIADGLDGTHVPTPVAEARQVLVDQRLVRHPLNLQSRRDEDHLRFGGPLTIATLLEPDEVNMMPERLPAPLVDGRPPSYSFLKAFLHGDRVVTILVAVHLERLYAITSYRLEVDTQPHRIDHERRAGQILYSRLLA